MKMTFSASIPLFCLATAVAVAGELGGRLEPMFDQH